MHSVTVLCLVIFLYFVLEEEKLSANLSKLTQLNCTSFSFLFCKVFCNFETKKLVRNATSFEKTGLM